MRQQMLIFFITFFFLSKQLLLFSNINATDDSFKQTSKIKENRAVLDFKYSSSKLNILESFNWKNLLWEASHVNNVELNSYKHKDFKIVLEKKFVQQGKFVFLDVQGSKDILKCIGFIGEKRINFFRMGNNEKFFRAYLPIDIQHPIGYQKIFVSVFFKDKIVKTQSIEIKVLRNIVRYIPVKYYKTRKILKRFKVKGVWKKKWVKIRYQVKRNLAPPLLGYKINNLSENEMKKDIQGEISNINDIHRSFFSLGGVEEDGGENIPTRKEFLEEDNFFNLADKVSEYGSVEKQNLAFNTHLQNDRELISINKDNKAKDFILKSISLKKEDPTTKSSKDSKLRSLENISFINEILDESYLDFETSNNPDIKNDKEELLLDLDYKKATLKSIQENNYFSKHYLNWIPFDYTNGMFILPLNLEKDKVFLTSQFGKYRRFFHKKRLRKGYHRGLDLAAPRGTKVYASNSGQVVIANLFINRGNAIVINHGRGICSVYYHLDTLDVKPGIFVRKGQKIGTVGSTGISTGFHLHWEIRLNGISTDTLNFKQKQLALF